MMHDGDRAAFNVVLNDHCPAEIERAAQRGPFVRLACRALRI
jgi:hypothetical protein